MTTTHKTPSGHRTAPAANSGLETNVQRAIATPLIRERSSPLSPNPVSRFLDDHTADRRRRRQGKRTDIAAIE
jgi:hypothetical protein